MQIVLKPCPFCGGTAELRDVRVYLATGWRIRCTGCGIGTIPVLIDHPHMTGKGSPDESTRYTSKQAAQIAADKWNRRIEA